MHIANRVIVTLIALILSTTPVFAHDYKAGDLEIRHPWSKAMNPGAKTGGGFMTITNHGTEPDRLIKISSDVADLIQVHEMKVDNGMMTMGEVPGGLEIAPGATVELTPGAIHVMFMSVKQPFKEGEKIKAVLTFEKAGDVEVEFKVEPANKGDDGHDMKNMKM
ncbi:copper chaperone PCu(A)C [Rhizobium sp. TH2]|uniref:copper chaperone PCu(A)C n=1 Tax=Rhizobium sp. TH2 TaxID=2775403 RepID=UPI0021589E99|nr:copper chaperone PCu(A)C [Rhizobium sp. TH2]UVC10106.1 copper chaperone PCu(A)C [Rhizobium sp. TH2]